MKLWSQAKRCSNGSASRAQVDIYLRFLEYPTRNMRKEKIPPLLYLPPDTFLQDLLYLDLSYHKRIYT